MPRHGIGQQVQRSSAGSIPHDRITILQICSSRSLPLDRPRQSASRHPPIVTNRPTTYRVRRDPRLIQQPFHHPPACWSASTPFTHLVRGTKIPIAQAATPKSPSRGFLPWRFAYAGPPCRPRHRHGAAIRKPSQERKWRHFQNLSAVPPNNRHSSRRAARLLCANSVSRHTHSITATRTPCMIDVPGHGPVVDALSDELGMRH